MAAAYRLHCSASWQRRHSYVAGVIFAAMFFVILLGGEGSLDAFSIVAYVVFSIAVGAGLVGVILLANRFNSGAPARQWANQFNLEGTITRFEYDPNGLRIIDRMFGGEMRWSEVKDFVENDEVLLIYRSPQFYYYISKLAVPEVELSRLVSVMQAAGVRQR